MDKYPGLNAWASTLRAQLASSSATTGFGDYVEDKGYVWLRTYVQGVFNDQPMVELAKTPGRQKSVKKVTRARSAAIAASAAKIKAANLIEQNAIADKENRNASPSRRSNLQNALLQARQENDSDDESEARSIKTLNFTSSASAKPAPMPPRSAARPPPKTLSFAVPNSVAEEDEEDELSTEHPVELYQSLQVPFSAPIPIPLTNYPPSTTRYSPSPPPTTLEPSAAKVHSSQSVERILLPPPTPVRTHHTVLDTPALPKEKESVFQLIELDSPVRPRDPGADDEQKEEATVDTSLVTDDDESTLRVAPSPAKKLPSGDDVQVKDAEHTSVRAPSISKSQEEAAVLQVSKSQTNSRPTSTSHREPIVIDVPSSLSTVPTNAPSASSSRESSTSPIESQPIHQDLFVPTKQSSPPAGSRSIAGRGSWLSAALSQSGGSATRVPPISLPRNRTSSFRARSSQAPGAASDGAAAMKRSVSSSILLVGRPSAHAKSHSSNIFASLATPGSGPSTIAPRFSVKRKQAQIETDKDDENKAKSSHAASTSYVVDSVAEKESRPAKLQKVEVEDTSAAARAKSVRASPVASTSRADAARVSPVTSTFSSSASNRPTHERTDSSSSLRAKEPLTNSNPLTISSLTSSSTSHQTSTAVQSPIEPPINVAMEMDLPAEISPTKSGLTNLKAALDKVRRGRDGYTTAMTSASSNLATRTFNLSDLTTGPVDITRNGRRSPSASSGSYESAEEDNEGDEALDGVEVGARAQAPVSTVDANDEMSGDEGYTDAEFDVAMRFDPEARYTPPHSPPVKADLNRMSQVSVPGPRDSNMSSIFASTSSSSFHDRLSSQTRSEPEAPAPLPASSSSTSIFSSAPTAIGNLFSTALGGIFPSSSVSSTPPLPPPTQTVPIPGKKHNPFTAATPPPPTPPAPKPTAVPFNPFTVSPRPPPLSRTGSQASLRSQTQTQVQTLTDFSQPYTSAQSTAASGASWFGPAARIGSMGGLGGADRSAYESDVTEDQSMTSMSEVDKASTHRLVEKEVVQSLGGKVKATEKEVAKVVAISSSEKEEEYDGDSSDVDEISPSEPPSPVVSRLTKAKPTAASPRDAEPQSSQVFNKPKDGPPTPSRIAVSSQATKKKAAAAVIAEKEKARKIAAENERAAYARAEEERQKRIEAERQRREEIEKRKREKEAAVAAAKTVKKKAEEDNPAQTKKRKIDPSPAHASSSTSAQRKPAPKGTPGAKQLLASSSFTTPGHTYGHAKTASQSSQSSQTRMGGIATKPVNKPMAKFGGIMVPAGSSEASGSTIRPVGGAKVSSSSMVATAMPKKVMQLNPKMEARIAAEVAKIREPPKSATPQPVEEEMDLPDIRSDYSNSDDEPPKDLPPWTDADALAAQLEAQATIDPEDVFGAIPELDMEKMFKGVRTHKFRNRTSSANWSGPDGLSRQEEENYAKRMGYSRQ